MEVAAVLGTNGLAPGLNSDAVGLSIELKTQLN